MAYFRLLMKNVLVDMHFLRLNPADELYSFAGDLGMAMGTRRPPDMMLHFYVPEKSVNVFGNDVQYEKQKEIDKYFKFSTGKFNVWHATTTVTPYQPFNKKTKFVFTIHDFNFMGEEDRSQLQKMRWLRLVQERVKRADYITFISDHARLEAYKYLDLGDKQSTVIYNGCNVPSKSNITAPLFEKPFLFSYGFFKPEKKFHLLPHLLGGNDYNLIIGGNNETPYKQAVIDAAAKAGVAERVHLAGVLAEEEKAWYYEKCDAFLLPSVVESFPTPAIEAMHFGKPVFLSMFSCLPEIGGDAVYYFESFDDASMKKTFEEGMQLYRETSPVEKVKERAAFFNWGDTALQYFDIYRELF